MRDYDKMQSETAERIFRSADSLTMKIFTYLEVSQNEDYSLE